MPLKRLIANITKITSIKHQNLFDFFKWHCALQILYISLHSRLLELGLGFYYLIQSESSINFVYLI